METDDIDKDTVGLLGKDGVFYLRNKSEIKRLRSHFKDLVFARKAFQDKKAAMEKLEIKIRKESNLESSIAPFQPSIDDMSKNIEMSKVELFGKVARHDMLLEKGKEYKQNVIEKRMETTDKDLKSCTFKPVINKPTKLHKRKTELDRLKQPVSSLMESRQKLDSSLANSSIASNSNSAARKYVITNTNTKVNQIRNGTQQQRDGNKENGIYKPICNKKRKNTAINEPEFKIDNHDEDIKKVGDYMDAHFDDCKLFRLFY